MAYSAHKGSLSWRGFRAVVLPLANSPRVHLIGMRVLGGDIAGDYRQTEASAGAAEGPARTLIGAPAPVRVHSPALLLLPVIMVRRPEQRSVDVSPELLGNDCRSCLRA
jgi:hypothetical protein